MPIVTIEHEEYPSVIVIEYNSLYKNELINFIHNIKIKDNKEEVYTEPYFFKIMQTNNKNIGLLTIDGRIEGYYYINKEKTYEEAIEKYHQVKDFYYQARQRHYDNVDKSLIPPLNAHLYGDVLVYFNRSISNLVNIVEEITGKDK